MQYLFPEILSSKSLVFFSSCTPASNLPFDAFQTTLNQWRSNPEFPLDLLDTFLWQLLLSMQDTTFYTARQLAFSYRIRGNEMFVNRKNKSITRSTICLAFHTALEMQEKGEVITGPKKLKTFGASYLYPIFLSIGVKYIW